MVSGSNYIGSGDVGGGDGVDGGGGGGN